MTETDTPQTEAPPVDDNPWPGLPGATAGFALAQAATERDAPLLVVTASSQDAWRLENELCFFAPTGLPVSVFPDWETLPYDAFSPLPEIVSQRLSTLYRLPEMERGIVIVPAATLMQRIAPRSFLDAHSLMLDVGDRLEIEPFRARLTAAGYQSVDQVMAHGEFAVRGSLIDLFPMGAAEPYRIDLFDDEVETIRTFDPETQLSVDEVPAIRLLPAREFPLDPDAIKTFRRAFRNAFEGDPQRSIIYRDVSKGLTPGGIESWLPLFFERTGTLFDYLPEGIRVAVSPGMEAAAEEFLREVAERYGELRFDPERPLLPPERLYLDRDDMMAALSSFPRVEPSTPATGGTVPDIQFKARGSHKADALLNFIHGFDGRVLLTAESTGRREALLETLREQGLRPKVVEDWNAFLADDAPLALTLARLEQGLVMERPRLALIAEAELFGERARQERRRRRPERDPATIIRNLSDLRPGSPVVHEDNGIGRYLGLQTLDVGGVKTEFLALEYAGGDKLYVPVSSLHLISRYSGTHPESAPLHRLGSGQWEKAKSKAARKVRDVAAELLDLYARRAAKSGHRFELDEEEYARFAEAFPFEETEDQQAAIEAVVSDLLDDRPADRVVCGDVGFGKTEVAMRAAFVAAQAGKQVAVLVPTTLLAQQHYQNFSDRFADWPVRVEVLSRFRSKKQVNAVLDGLAEGKVDIVIGTHKLLQKDVRFKDLGLVIIDEEQRFGVRQKEQLKKLRAEVDLLTLTATPIPRTLNMSMSGLRDLSIIATPPARRHPIKTFVSEWNQGLVYEACLREIRRGGQVYFLHNQVESIERFARQIQELVPEATVRHAHGQMRERELEQVMLDFYHRRFNVLVCTTIIESGIDIPNANTILIDRADKLGLAQLHQLRGRVGRSHHRAYAYLLTPHTSAMTGDAKKRLEAIASLEELGAGFTLATHDLEIRGAGELLGDEQSGQIDEIGFTLYTELLERAVTALREGREPNLESPLEHGPEIDLRIPALLPDDYVPDVHNRLVLYKRIASAADENELENLQVEMIDRFGLLPPAAKQLFAVTALKLRAAAMGITRIDAGPQGGRLLFNEQPQVDPMKIIGLIQQQPQQYKLDGQDKLRFTLDLDKPERRLQFVNELLTRIKAD